MCVRACVRACEGICCRSPVSADDGGMHKTWSISLALVPTCPRMTGTISALHRRSRRSWDTQWCLTQRDHSRSRRSWDTQWCLTQRDHSRSQRSWDTQWCLTQRDHTFQKATTASCFLRATSCMSPSREPNWLVTRQPSPARLFLL